MNSYVQKCKLSRAIFLLFIGLVLLNFTGCAEFQRRIDDLFGKTKKEQAYKQLDAREEAIQKYNYKGIMDEIFSENPVISPSIVTGEEKLTQSFQFAVLSPQKEKEFKISEVITLSGGNILIELSRKDSEKQQGVHVSTFEVVIPKDLPPGDYSLITTVNANGQKKTAIANFKVK